MSRYIQEEKPDHHYRTEIPNIVFDLGLTPKALVLYAYYKRVAGDSGYCNQCRKTICENLNIKIRSLNIHRKELEEVRSELGGKPLIRVEVRKNEKDEFKSSKIQIIDIWRENGDFYRKKRTHSEGEGRANNARGRANNARGRANNARKEEPLEEDLLYQAGKEPASACLAKEITEIMEKADIPKSSMRTVWKEAGNLRSLKEVIKQMNGRKNCKNPIGIMITKLRSGEIEGAGMTEDERRDSLLAKVEANKGRSTTFVNFSLEGFMLKINFPIVKKSLSFDVNAWNELERAVKILKLNGLLKT